MDRIGRILVAGVCLVAGAKPCFASIVLLSNVGEATRDTSLLMQAPGLWGAQSFVTDGSSYTLSSVDTVLGDIEGSPTITAELRLFDLSSPALTTFSVPLLTSAPSLVTVTPDSLVTLAPNTTYWIVFGVSGPGTLGWSYAEGNNFIGPGSFGAYNYSMDDGVNWPFSGTDNPFKIRVNVDPVSSIFEPSSILLLVAGLSGIAGGRRFRRRS